MHQELLKKVECIEDIQREQLAGNLVRLVRLVRLESDNFQDQLQSDLSNLRRSVAAFSISAVTSVKQSIPKQSLSEKWVLFLCAPPSRSR